MSKRSASVNAEYSRPCELCAGTEHSVVYPADEGITIRPEDFTVTGSRMIKTEVLRCKGCGLVFSPAASGYCAYYARTVDDGYLQGQRTRSKELYAAFRKAARFLAPDRRPARVLDVGCATGPLLQVLVSRPEYECRGIEPSEWAAAAANAQGLPVTQGYFEDFACREGCFDLVAMFDSLEHMASPSAAVKKAYEVLKPGGVLAITTPNIDSAYHWLTRRSYWFIEAMHLFYFSPATIRRMLSQCGFEVVRVRRHWKCLPAGYALERLIRLLPFGRRIEKTRGFRALFFIPLWMYVGQMLVIARKE